MKTGWFAAFAAFVSLAGANVAQAQTEAPATVAVTPAAPATQSIRIPAGTIVQVELTESLSSQTSQREQLFGLRLAEPIVVDGREIVAAGAPGGGEVIDAHPRAFSGRQGRLIVSGRFIEIGGQRARIRGMQMMAAGANRTGTAVAVGVVAPLASFFVQGGAVEFPAGARATAIVATDIDIPIEASEAAIAELAIPAPMGQATAAGEDQ